MAEYRASWPDALAAKQPMVLYNIAARVQGLLDLRNPEVTKALGLSDDDLFGPWRFASSPTPMQRLGAAVARQKRVGALLHPSSALHDLGREGWNFAIYPSAMQAGDCLDVLGRAGGILRTLHVHDEGPSSVPCRIVHPRDSE